MFDTATDELVEVVDTLGTLLYGVAADSAGRVFIAQTEARNDANGKAGTEGHGMAELENRAFLNRITRVSCGAGCGAPAFFELEPLPPADPARDEALATPFGIAVSGDDSTLVVTAAASSRVFTVDADTGAVLGRADVGAIPRGVALESTAEPGPRRGPGCSTRSRTACRSSICQTRRCRRWRRPIAPRGPHRPRSEAGPHRVQQRRGVEHRHLRLRELPRRRAH